MDGTRKRSFWACPAVDRPYRRSIIKPGTSILPRMAPLYPRSFTELWRMTRNFCWKIVTWPTGGRWLSYWPITFPTTISNCWPVHLLHSFSFFVFSYLSFSSPFHGNYNGIHFDWRYYPSTVFSFNYGVHWVFHWVFSIYSIYWIFLLVFCGFFSLVFSIYFFSGFCHWFFPFIFSFIFFIGFFSLDFSIFFHLFCLLNFFIGFFLLDFFHCFFLWFLMFDYSFCFLKICFRPTRWSARGSKVRRCYNLSHSIGKYWESCALVVDSRIRWHESGQRRHSKCSGEVVCDVRWSSRE